MNNNSIQLTGEEQKQNASNWAKVLFWNITSWSSGIDKIRKIKDMEFWLEAIKGEAESFSEIDTKKIDNIRNWYEKERKEHSYSAANYIIPTERTMLLQSFKEDYYYHLKNLVESIGRVLMTELLRADGLNITTYSTSDADDVFGWVDYIVEIHSAEGKTETIGIDFAISDNEKFLKQKQEKKLRTYCREFDEFKGRKPRSISRQIYALPPKVMSKFTFAYMEKIIETGITPSSWEILSLFEAANTHGAHDIQETTEKKVDAILH